MKVYAISDLHLCISGSKPMDIFGETWENYIEQIEADWQNKVTKDDIVLLAGDLSWAMKLEDAEKDFEFFNKLNGTKIIIKGNHDYWWNSLSKVRASLPQNTFALQNDAIKIDNFIFCGSRGWILPDSKNVSEEDKKIFDREVIRMELSLESAKNLQKNNETIICMIHYPPFQASLYASKFTELFEKYHVHSVVYGHIHGNTGNMKKIYNINGVKYYLTSCDQVENKLIEIY